MSRLELSSLSPETLAAILTALPSFGVVPSQIHVVPPPTQEAPEETDDESVEVLAVGGAGTESIGDRNARIRTSINDFLEGSMPSRVDGARGIPCLESSYFIAQLICDEEDDETTYDCVFRRWDSYFDLLKSEEGEGISLRSYLERIFCASESDGKLPREHGAEFVSALLLSKQNLTFDSTVDYAKLSERLYVDHIKRVAMKNADGTPVMVPFAATFNLFCPDEPSHTVYDGTAINSSAEGGRVMSDLPVHILFPRCQLPELRIPKPVTVRRVVGLMRNYLNTAIDPFSSRMRRELFTSDDFVGFQMVDEDTWLLLTRDS